jgi:hypothetical protein
MTSDLKSRPEDRPPHFTSRIAYPCYRSIVTDAGAGDVWFVMLPDGYLLDCGHRQGEARAKILSKIINDAGFEKIDVEALKAFRNDQ